MKFISFERSIKAIVECSGPLQLFRGMSDLLLKLSMVSLVKRIMPGRVFSIAPSD